ncbi:MAG: CGP-CTERM sorting domain-containing protein [Thermococcus sp.]|nr:CGP-CTERM sorting domain-containing protein [Thermococcus sp.]
MRHIAMFILTTLILVGLVFPGSATASKNTDTAKVATLTVKLETSTQNYTEINDVLKVLKNRLASSNLSANVMLTSTGDTITVQIYNITPEEETMIKELIESQGALYFEFNGVVFATGADITVHSSNYGLSPYQCPTCWFVGFELSEKAQEKFKEIASGKLGWPVDVYLDPPVNSLIIVSPRVYQEMNSQDFMGRPDSGTGTPDPLVKRLKEAFNITIVEYSNQSAEEIVDNATALGKDKIILADIPEELYNEVKDLVVSKDLDLRVSYYTPQQGEDLKDFVKRILNLYGPYILRFDPSKLNTMGFQLTGSASTKEEALQEARKIYSVLKGGSLPVKLKVISVEWEDMTLTSSSPAWDLTSPTTTPSSLPESNTSEKKGLCGPAAIAFLAVLPLFLRKH